MDEKYSQLKKSITNFRKNHPKFEVLQLPEGVITEETQETNKINENFLLQSKKILIFEKKIHDDSLKLFTSTANKMFKGTSDNDDILLKCIVPSLNKASKLIFQQKKFKEGFGIMFAVCWFLKYEGEGVISDNELYDYDMKKFVKIFKDINSNWKKLLESQYKGLGFFNQQTKDNIIEFLKDFEENTNESLTIYEDFIEDSSIYPKISIFTNEQQNASKSEQTISYLLNKYTNFKGHESKTADQNQKKEERSVEYVQIKLSQEAMRNLQRNQAIREIMKRTREEKSNTK